MKREFLKGLLVGVENADDLIEKIMAENGADITKTKNDLTAENTKLQEKVTKLETDASKYKDYDTILKENQAFKVEKENGRKTDFLKAQGCKHPELFIDKVDFTKGAFDETKKTFTGLDDSVKSLKDAYGDMFESADKNPNPFNPNPFTQFSQKDHATPPNEGKVDLTLL